MSSHGFIKYTSQFQILNNSITNYSKHIKIMAYLSRKVLWQHNKKNHWRVVSSHNKAKRPKMESCVKLIHNHINMLDFIDIRAHDEESVQKTHAGYYSPPPPKYFSLVLSAFINACPTLLSTLSLILIFSIIAFSMILSLVILAFAATFFTS